MIALLMGSLRTYYGLDWIAMAVGLAGTWFVTNQNRKGFLVGALGCAMSIVVAAISHQYGSILSNLVTITFLVRGFGRWGKARDGSL
jgi:hypothetical protein